MGADARIYLFDHHGYLEERVPSLRRLLREGAGQGPEGARIEGMVASNERMRRRWDHPTLRRSVAFLEALRAGLGVDLESDCRLLAPDLSPIRPLREIERYLGDWEDRRCPHEGCSAAPRCPYRGEGLEAELLSEVFRYGLAPYLGRSVFVGRSSNFAYWEQWLFDEGLAREEEPDTELRSLLRRLGVCGFHVGYQWANSDGVHGWLDPVESAALVRAMEGLPLPEIETSVEAVEATLVPTSHGGRRYHIEGWSSEALLLSFVRVMARMAEAEEKGLLLGLDLHVEPLEW